MPCTDVRVVFRKWKDLPHWEYDAVRLGEDEHGTWLGAVAGTRLTRPGVEFASPQGFVSLVPDDSPFVATFYEPREATGGPSAVDVYVDITTAPRWAEGQVTMVDLDLDVVRGRAGRVWVDDEDEFADHRIRFGYPPEIVELALTSCDELLSAVTRGEPPFDREASLGWLTRLAAASVS